MHPILEKSGFRRGEYVAYTAKGAQRIKRGGEGWQAYALASQSGQTIRASAPTLQLLAEKLERLASLATLASPTPALLAMLNAYEWQVKGTDAEAQHALEMHVAAHDIFELKEERGSIVIAHPSGDAYKDNAHRERVQASVDTARAFLALWGSRLTLAHL